MGDINITGKYRVNGIPITTGEVGQTPWHSNIDAAEHELLNLKSLRFKTTDNYPICFSSGSGGGGEDRFSFIRDASYTKCIYFNHSTGDIGFGGSSGSPRLYLRHDNITVADGGLLVEGNIDVSGTYRINGVIQHFVPTYSSSNNNEVLTVYNGNLAWRTPTGASQTPWTSNIDAANHTLTNLASLNGHSIIFVPSYSSSNNNQVLTVVNGSLVWHTPTSGGESFWQDGGNNSIYYLGRVGVGTIPHPAVAFQFRAAANQQLAFSPGQFTDGVAIQAYNDAVNLYKSIEYRASVHYFGEGNVGINVNTPAYRLDVNGDCNVRSGNYRLNGVQQYFVPNPAGVTNGYVLTIHSNQMEWREPTGGSGGESQTPWKTDIDADGHDLFDVGSIEAERIYLDGARIPDPDHMVLNTGSYANPSWITNLAWSKITGAPTIPPELWSRWGVDIVYTNDKVGVNTTDVLYRFEVAGRVRFKPYAADTAGCWFNTAGRADAFFLGVTAGSDFRLYSAYAAANVLYFDGLNSRAGFNKAGADYTVDVNGDCNVTGVYRINGTPMSFPPSTSGAAEGNVLTVGSSGSMVWNPPASGGAPQTPWQSNIDGANYQLVGVRSIMMGGNVPNADTSGTALYIQNTGQYNDNGIYFQKPGSSASVILGAIYWRNTSLEASNKGVGSIQCIASLEGTVTDRGSYMEFATREASKSSSMRVMVLSQYQRCGIGAIGSTGFPNYKLDVNGDINIDDVGGAGYTFRINGVPLQMGGSQTPWTSTINADSNYLGNVRSIGINSVAGPASGILINAASFQDVIYAYSYSAGAKVGIKLDTGGPTLDLRAYATGALPFANCTAVLGNGAPLIIATNNVERMRFGLLGGVGIGTQVTDRSLTVSGDLNVVAGQYLKDGFPMMFLSQVEYDTLQAKISDMENTITILRSRMGI